MEYKFKTTPIIRDLLLSKKDFKSFKWFNSQLCEIFHFKVDGRLRPDIKDKYKYEFLFENDNLLGFELIETDKDNAWTWLSPDKKWKLKFYVAHSRLKPFIEIESIDKSDCTNNSKIKTPYWEQPESFIDKNYTAALFRPADCWSECVIRGECKGFKWTEPWDDNTIYDNKWGWFMLNEKGEYSHLSNWDFDSTNTFYEPNGGEGNSIVWLDENFEDKIYRRDIFAEYSKVVEEKNKLVEQDIKDYPDRMFNFEVQEIEGLEAEFKGIVAKRILDKDYITNFKQLGDRVFSFKVKDIDKAREVYDSLRHQNLCTFEVGEFKGVKNDSK